MAELNVNPTRFLWPKEEKLFKYVIRLNKMGIVFPHTSLEHKNISIPLGIKLKVIEVLKLKMDANIYEQSQSSYRSKWFFNEKKNRKICII
jgi:hypothetical protein